MQPEQEHVMHIIKQYIFFLTAFLAPTRNLRKNYVYLCKTYALWKRYGFNYTWHDLSSCGETHFEYHHAVFLVGKYCSLDTSTNWRLLKCRLHKAR